LTVGSNFDFEVLDGFILISYKYFKVSALFIELVSYLIFF
jgi:hypothetical protein